MATASQEELRNRVNRIERPPYRFSLSNGGQAEIKRIIADYKRKGEKETKKLAYAIEVGGLDDVANVEGDVSGLLALASLASRERADFGYWSVRDHAGSNKQNWRFGYGKWPARPRGEEPLIRNDANSCGFLGSALKIYLATSESSSLDSAIYAILARELPIEPRIVRLYTGLQATLILALSLPSSTKKRVEELFREFKRKYPIDMSDLWPLFDGVGKPSLNRIRNTLVHGKAFTSRSDFKSLSIASENLQWLLERVLLAYLGWDIESSAVSKKNLRRYTAHQWKPDYNRLKI